MPLPSIIDVAPDRFYGFDIETDTTVDGLDPDVAAVVAIAVVTATERLVFTGPEAELLVAADAALAALPPGVLVTWNGSRFDLPFVAVRAATLGVPIGLRVVPRVRTVPHRNQPDGAGSEADERRNLRELVGGWGRHHHLDAYRVYRADVGRTLGLSCGLKPLSRFLGYSPVEVDRSRIETLSPAELEAYVASDADLARRLALRRLPSIALAVDRPPVAAFEPRPPHVGDTVVA